jgi:outer membrane protein OmpA-like peptidoglycan-associated protein
MRLLPLFFLFCGSLFAQPTGIFDSLQIYQSDTLYFESGKADLNAASLQKLDNFSPASTSDERIYLTGHTDAIGSTKYNEDLARRRANQASAILIEKGWPDTALLIQTFGESTPVASNDSDLDRSRNRRVTIDAYRAIPFREFTGRVVNPVDQSPIPDAQVRIHSRSFLDTLRTDIFGGFRVNLPLDSVVGIEVSAKGYFLDAKMIRISTKTISELSFELDPAVVGKIATIDNLFFVGDQAILLKESEPELPRLLRFMQINTHLKVEIAGHVNVPNAPPIPKSSSSWDLSVRRAKMVYDYLIENGIPSEKIRYQGYGNHEMIYPKARSPLSQAANRRVEIRILENITKEEK